MTKLLRFLRPSHQHTAMSATLLLMGTVMLSRVIGYAREAYIAFAFGAGSQTDAYVAAFTLPDFLNYIVAGGAASITFISIYTRFLAEKRDADAQKTFSIIITVMTMVMIVGTILTEIYAPAIRALVRERVLAGADRAVRSPHAHPSAGADFLLCRWSGFGGVAVAPAVSVPGLWAADLQRIHHCGRGHRRTAFRHRFVGVWGAGREALSGRFWPA